MEESLIKDFIEYAKTVEGYEKGEGQTFLNRFWNVFGYRDVHDAGGKFEDKVKIDKSTKFSDMLIEGKILVEMKSRGENLDNHWKQAKNYWDELYSKRPKYVMLCNFDEFWIYDWNIQKEALDKLTIKELSENTKRWEAFNFLLKEELKPKFKNDLEEVTREVADKLVFVYNSLVKRKQEIQLEREQIQRFVLQCLVALFAEDVNLFPRSNFFNSIITECLNGQSSYDLFYDLFSCMNSPEVPIAGKYKGVAYFNGGLFKEINHIELNAEELIALKEASDKDWSKVQPYILGAIFEDSMEKEERHAFGSHFTYESDIMKIVNPTIVKPFKEKIEKAKKLEDLKKIHKELCDFKVLDPACGSGNFLYISYREIRHLEIDIFKKMIDEYASVSQKDIFVSGINSKNFYGIDINPFAVELAKVTMSIAKKYAADDFNNFKTTIGKSLGLNLDSPIPFDNMDQNIICMDAILNEWPEVDVIIGNPPYITANDMNNELGIDYTKQIRETYPNIPGKADFCVWWFRKAHECLKVGGRAGLVGTNTISQNYSRIGGLDYITANDGIIFNAISSQVWSGDAVVYVSIVNWQKGSSKDIKVKRLYCPVEEKKDSEFVCYELNNINSMLKPICNVSLAFDLKKTNDSPTNKSCFQGQTVDNGFLIDLKLASAIIRRNSNNKKVLKPFLIGEDLLGSIDSTPQRVAIDFNDLNLYEIQKYKEPLKIIEKTILPIVKEKAAKQEYSNKNSKIKKYDRINHYNKWWTYWRNRKPLLDKLQMLNKYIVCSRVTKRPIFEFISTKIRPGDALVAFTFEDDYSFGIISSNIHYKWYVARISTLKGDPRYTNTTAYNSFVWPQFGIPFATNKEKYINENKEQIQKLINNVAIAAKDFYLLRDKIRNNCQMSLRDIYRTLEKPGKNELKNLQEKLDKAVIEAYRFGTPKNIWSNDILQMLLNLNLKCGEFEKQDIQLVSPGLPDFYSNKQLLCSDYCINVNREK